MYLSNVDALESNGFFHVFGQRRCILCKLRFVLCNSCEQVTEKIDRAIGGAFQSVVGSIQETQAQITTPARAPTHRRRRTHTPTHRHRRTDTHTHARTHRFFPSCSLWVGGSCSRCHIFLPRVPPFWLIDRCPRRRRRGPS